MRIWLIAILLLAVGTALGQDLAGLDVQRHSWDVFLRSEAGEGGGTVLVFVDLLTGETSAFNTQGERFSLVDGGVIYFDRAEKQVKLAKPESGLRDHPFVSMASGDYRVDWVVSGGRRRIAWTVSRKQADGQLVSTIHHADSAGTDVRDLLSYGPRVGLRLVPVAFSHADDALYMDVHPEGTGDFKPYDWHTGVFSLGLDDGEISTLPGNTTCLCAVGFGEDLMLRLAPNAETSGIDVEIHSLVGEATQSIPSVSRGNYDEAGNLLVSPDGKLAVYALSQVSDFGGAEQEIRTVLVLVDLENGRQVVINNPMLSLLRPVKWTEDNSAILFTAEGMDGTWKISLVDGRSVKVADAVYLGTLSSARAAGSG